MRAIIASGLLVLALGAGAGGVNAQSVSASADAVRQADRRFDALVADAKLPMAGVLVFDTEGPLYQRLTPDFTTSRPVPIASASKWIASALIMTAVDRGELSLGTTVGELIPEAPPALRSATLAQLLSHTSGMGGRMLSNMPPVASLEESVFKLFEEPVPRAPGAGFAYGGASMQVAGLMLERAAKKPFATLFAERIAGPLGMTTAKFGSPKTWGTGEVPWVAGGMAASLDDYRRFLLMMLGNGSVDGKRILSPEAIAAIETEMLQSTPIVFRPNGVGTAQYGLGVWCEEVGADRRCGRVSSAGAFGAYPWLDRRSGRAGIFLTRSSLRAVAPGAYALRDATAAIRR